MITVNLTRGGDAALDDYYSQSYELVLVRLGAFLAMAALERLGVAPPGVTFDLYGKLPAIASTPRFLRLARQGRTGAVDDALDILERARKKGAL